MLTKFKSIGGVFVGICFLLAVLLIPALFIHGATWVGARVFPWLLVVSIVVFFGCLVVLLPLSFFSYTRKFAAGGFMAASYLFGITAWTWSLVLTYMLWGGVAVFIGIFLMGVGVLPFALIATAGKGMWSPFWQIIALFMLTWSLRVYSAYLTAKSEDAEVFF